MKDIQKVHFAHTINTVALSVISVYVPIYLLTLGYSLERVILFFAIAPSFGLLLGLFVYTRLFQRLGLINTFILYYPLQIIYLTSLFLLQEKTFPLEYVALLYGAANMVYWMPMNLLLIKRSQQEEIGKNLSTFFALPKLFGIFGPLVGALLVPFLGFWPVFVIAIIGVLCSFIPLMSVHDKDVKVSLNFTKAWARLKRNKSLFLFEAFDNVIEESEWFWGIYVYLMIGSLSTPGIIGSLEALGGAVLTFIIGKHADTKSKQIIPFASLALIAVFVARIFITEPIPAYIITFVASCVMTLFLITYFSTIYKSVKGDEEEEFIILREIPTVLGRMVVFGGIILLSSYLNLFFLIPVIFTILLLILYYWKKNILT